jgi:hypothetical protein
MSPESDLNDLAQKLQKRQNDAHYRRLRAIQQFSHRFRFAALLVSFFFMALGFIFYMLNMQSQQLLFVYLMLGSVFLGWGYLLALPILFVTRTSLLAYVLEKHWVWLSMALGLPIDIYFMPSPHATGLLSLWSRMPITFFAFLLWGFIRRKARHQVFMAETRKQDDLWKQLLTLDTLDIALLGFWSMRPTQPNDAPRKK